jgi:hypothetical protein
VPLPAVRVIPAADIATGDHNGAAHDPTGKSGADFQKPLSSPFAKNILIFRIHKSPYTLLVLSHKGRLEIVTDAGQDAVDASGAADESAFLADGEVVWF